MSTGLSNVFDQPLHIELKSSRILLAVATGLYILAVLFWLQVPLPGRVAATLYAGLAIHFLFLSGLHILNRLPVSINRLGWDHRRGWWLQYVDGRRRHAELCMPVFVSRYLVALTFRTGRLRYRSVIVIADRLEAEAFRRLRVRLIQSAYDSNT
jgi:hypothetical protein